MHKVKQVKQIQLFPIVKEILDRNGKARVTVTGSSMYPFLRENTDSVELVPASFNTIKRGDIVLILRDSGVYVLHRILLKKRCSFYIAGDAQNWIEGPLQPEQLVAATAAIWRKERRIECSNILWKGLSGLWVVTFPIRGMIIRSARLLLRLWRNIVHGGKVFEKTSGNN